LLKQNKQTTNPSENTYTISQLTQPFLSTLTLFQLNTNVPEDSHLQQYRDISVPLEWTSAAILVMITHKEKNQRKCVPLLKHQKCQTFKRIFKISNLLLRKMVVQNLL